MMANSYDRPAESRDDLNAILSALPVGILVFNPAGQVMSDNPAARRIFGMTAFKPASLRCGDYIGCCHRHADPAGCGSTEDCPECEINNAIAGVLSGGTDGPAEQKKKILRDKGRENNLWIQFSVVPVRMQEQRCATLIVQDITRDRQETTELIENRHALVLAKKQVETANRAKSRFISNMSHELKTPLNAVIGFAQLLARDPLLSKRQRSDVAVIQRSGNDLLKMINDILDFSRIEAGQMEVSEIDFSLAGLLDDIEAQFLSPCEDKGLELAVARDPGLPVYLSGDKAKFRQILVKLLSNAVKNTSRGKIELRIRSEILRKTHYLETDTYRLTVEVADSGVGISEEDLTRIFDPFERGVDTGNLAGTGLGLVICREYAALLGGDIRAKSRKGQGTCFSFTVVMKKGRPVSTKKGPEHRRVVRLDPVSGPVRILVVDDDPVNQTLLNALLRPAGFEVAQAFDGLEALTVFDRFHPHAVFMDMRMPGMDGYEAARRIKQTPEGRSTPIVALTASTLGDDRHRIEQAGMDACVRKPFQGPQIFDVLKQCLGLKYVFEEKSSSPASAPEVMQTPISVLPGPVQQSLRQAVEDGNMVRFSEWLDPFEKKYPELTAGLGRLADNFDYPALLSILEKPGVPEDTTSKENRDDS